MLLEFRCSNYKTFKQEMVFSMEPAPKQKGLDYSILQETSGGKKLRGLCSSIIYGPNAAGKTNIIGAMDTFKKICLRGNIRNATELDNPNYAGKELELIPNRSYKKAEPVSFGIVFTKDKFLIKYSLSISIGKFMERDAKRKIESEELVFNGLPIFKREKTLQVFTENINKEKEHLETALKNPNVAKELAEDGLKADELFLANGFRIIFGDFIPKLIESWLENNFRVVYHANAIKSTPKATNMMSQPGKVEGSKDITAALSEFGMYGNRIGYVYDDKAKQIRLASIIQEKLAIPAEVFESYGTIRLANLYPLIVEAFLYGDTLVVDEFDASLHPMALMSLINIFHNDEINIHHAQLIFNTHNPIFLTDNLYRRDEIRFVEREGDSSEVYSLADFGTAGSEGVRKGADYMKNYFMGRYGAVQEVDFSDLIKQIVERPNIDKGL